SVTARRAGTSRVYSRKPEILPMDGLPGFGNHDTTGYRLGLYGLLHHSLEFVWKHLHKLRQHRVPVFQNLLGARAAGRVKVPVNCGVQDVLIVRIENLLEIDRGLVTAILHELAFL